MSTTLVPVVPLCQGFLWLRLRLELRLMLRFMLKLRLMLRLMFRPREGFDLYLKLRLEHLLSLCHTL